MIGSILNGIRISSAVSATGTVTTGNTGTMYTCPASSYAIVQVAVTWASAFSGSANLRIDSKQVFFFDDNTGGNAYTFPVAQLLAGSLTHPVVLQLTVGPSQVLDLVNSGGSTATYYVTGVCFISGT